jgi:hypothetical protein
VRLDAWIASGERVPVALGDETFEIFRRISGSGPSRRALSAARGAGAHRPRDPVRERW